MVNQIASTRGMNLREYLSSSIKFGLLNLKSKINEHTKVAETVLVLIFCHYKGVAVTTQHRTQIGVNRF